MWVLLRGCTHITDKSVDAIAKTCGELQSLYLT